MSETINTTLGTGCFIGNKKLKTVKISANITTLGTDCFRGNDALTDIIFDAPENLQYILPWCFSSDTSLKSPFSCKNVIQLGGDNDEGSYNPAFDDSVNIPYIDFRGRTLDYLPEIGTAEFKNMPNIKIIVDEDKYEDWMDTYGEYNWGPKICIDENGTKPVVAQPINRNDYLTITALEDNVSIGFTGFYANAYSTLKYNLTGKDDGWSDFTEDGIILGSSGDQISFKGNFRGGYRIGRFDLPNKCNLSGQLDRALVDESIWYDDVSYIFSELFKDCEGIINAKDLSVGQIAANNFSNDYMFKNIFQGCSNLLSAPELKLGSMGHNSLFGLFDGCTNLNKIVLEATYSLCNDGQYIISVDENTLPDLSSKDEPGYLYISDGGFDSYHHQDGDVNILEYAQSHNWVPLTKYDSILYWNKDNIDERVTIKSIKSTNSVEYNIGGAIGTSCDLNFNIVRDSEGLPYPYVCNIFTTWQFPFKEYDWKLVGRNVKIGSNITIRDVLNREGIDYDSSTQCLQVIIMGTTDE